MNYIENYCKVMKNVFNKEDITEKEAKKNLNNKQKTVITNSTLIEHRIEKGMMFDVVTDLVTEESHVYVPRGKVKKNEELNLISGITSLGLFDSDNVYCGQLDPNNTGIRKPIELNPEEDETKKEDKEKEYIESDFDVKVDDEYETIFGFMKIDEVDENKDMVISDSNNVQMHISFEDFKNLNPIKMNDDNNKIENKQDTDKKNIDLYRVLFKTLEPDGGVKEWCMTFEEEDEMNKQLESIKQNPSLIEIVGILNPSETTLNQKEEKPEEEQAQEEGEEGFGGGGLGSGFGEEGFGNEVGGEGFGEEGVGEETGGGENLEGGGESFGNETEGEEGFGGGEAPKFSLNL